MPLYITLSPFTCGPKQTNKIICWLHQRYRWSHRRSQLQNTDFLTALLLPPGYQRRPSDVQKRHHTEEIRSFFSAFSTSFEPDYNMPSEQSRSTVQLGERWTSQSQGMLLQQCSAHSPRKQCRPSPSSPRGGILQMLLGWASRQSSWRRSSLGTWLCCMGVDPWPSPPTWHTAAFHPPCPNPRG